MTHYDQLQVVVCRFGLITLRIDASGVPRSEIGDYCEPEDDRSDSTVLHRAHGPHRGDDLDNWRYVRLGQRLNPWPHSGRRLRSHDDSAYGARRRRGQGGPGHFESRH